MAATSELEELDKICPGAAQVMDGGVTYFFLPSLRVPVNDNILEVDGMLCTQAHSGYMTRLFLSERIAGKGTNWNVHNIGCRPWHTWSWNNVPENLRPAQILAEHLRALR